QQLIIQQVPRDIVLNEGGRKTGFLASNKEEYTEAILEVIKMPEAERLAIAAAARKHAQRFSEQKFFEDFQGCCSSAYSSTQIFFMNLTR
ncbi:unnamed protein product, partial [Musa acuminata var. zebrina]